MPRARPAPRWGGRARRATFLLGAVAAVVAAAVHFLTAEPGGRSALAFRATVAAAPSVQVLRSATAGAWGGRYDTGSGQTVEILASDEYLEDEALPRAWAAYLGQLVHGRELSSLTLYLAPPEEVEDVCGRGALACYSPQRMLIVAPGEDPSDGTSAEAVVAHEYGHHVAANRVNPPWRAVDWGTKRWASQMNVCARTAAGELYPGDEDRFYELNPGEGFAEAYRVLNEVRGVTPAFTWDVVDERFFPNAAALAAVEQDVTAPWTANGVSTLSGRLRARQARLHRVSTPLDGTITVSLRVPAAARLRLELVADKTGRVRRSAAALARRSATVRATVCGERAFRLRVTALSGSGAYRLTVSKP